MYFGDLKFCFSAVECARWCERCESDVVADEGEQSSPCFVGAIYSKSCEIFDVGCFVVRLQFGFLHCDYVCSVCV